MSEVAEAMSDRDHTITFSPPLPCITVNAHQLCGKPATAATIYPTGGGYLMQPICRDCTAKLAAIYLGGNDGQ